MGWPHDGAEGDGMETLIVKPGRRSGGRMPGNYPAATPRDVGLVGAGARRDRDGYDNERR